MSVKVEGLEELEKALEDTLPREARNILRRTVTKVAAGVRNDTRRAAPKDEGTLRKAITSRRKSSPPWMAEAGVYITHGKGVKHDAFYWRFVEFGTQSYEAGDRRSGGSGRAKRAIPARPAHPFIVPTVEKWRARINTEFRKEFWPQFEREMTKRAKK